MLEHKTISRAGVGYCRIELTQFDTQQESLLSYKLKHKIFLSQKLVSSLIFLEIMCLTDESFICLTDGSFICMAGENENFIHSMNYGMNFIPQFIQINSFPMHFLVLRA